MDDQELTLSYSELEEQLKDPNSVLSKRLKRRADDEKKWQEFRGGRVDFLGDEPFDINYDDAREDNNYRPDDYWVEEIPKRYSLEEKLLMEHDPDPGIDWGD